MKYIHRLKVSLKWKSEAPESAGHDWGWKTFSLDKNNEEIFLTVAGRKCEHTLNTTSMFKINESVGQISFGAVQFCQNCCVYV